MYHLIISHGYPSREKDVCVMSSENLALLKADYRIAKNMGQNPRIYKTELMPPLMDKLNEIKPISPGF